MSTFKGRALMSSTVYKKMAIVSVVAAVGLLAVSLFIDADATTRFAGFVLAGAALVVTGVLAVLHEKRTNLESGVETDKSWRQKADRAFLARASKEGRRAQRELARRSAKQELATEVSALTVPEGSLQQESAPVSLTNGEESAAGNVDDVALDPVVVAEQDLRNAVAAAATEVFQQVLAEKVREVAAAHAELAVQQEEVAVMESRADNAETQLREATAEVQRLTDQHAKDVAQLAEVEHSLAEALDVNRSLTVAAAESARVQSVAALQRVRHQLEMLGAPAEAVQELDFAVENWQ
jgi:myosin heavy subunit